MAQPRILLVEDEFLIRMTLAEALSEDGFEVIEAASGEEALALLQRDPSIALLLTDLNLSDGLSGLALAAEARRERPRLPAIFMTGRPDLVPPSGNAQDALIAKPYMPSDVSAAARRLLAP